MRALFLGRFQPPHRGHLHAIRTASRGFDSVFVGVGSAQRSHEPNNPFTVGERFEILLASLVELRLTNVHLFPVPDIHRHSRWVGHVESLVPSFDAVVTNNPLTRRLFGAAGYKIVDAALWKPDACSGRRIRARWARGQDADELLLPAARRVLERIRGPQRVRKIRGEVSHGGRRANP